VRRTGECGDHFQAQMVPAKTTIREKRDVKCIPPLMFPLSKKTELALLSDFGLTYRINRIRLTRLPLGN